MSRIEPTVGRVVHVVMPDRSAVHAAIIVEVSEHVADHIKVFDCNDICHRELKLVQSTADSDVNVLAPYAVWMPYQKGQAAKTEALESDLDVARRMASAGSSLIGDNHGNR